MLYNNCNVELLVNILLPSLFILVHFVSAEPELLSTMVRQLVTGTTGTITFTAIPAPDTSSTDFKTAPAPSTSSTAFKTAPAPSTSSTAFKSQDEKPSSSRSSTPVQQEEKKRKLGATVKHNF